MNTFYFFPAGYHGEQPGIRQPVGVGFWARFFSLVLSWIVPRIFGEPRSSRRVEECR
jgi:hypothetical protein